MIKWTEKDVVNAMNKALNVPTNNIPELSAGIIAKLQQARKSGASVPRRF